MSGFELTQEQKACIERTAAILNEKAPSLAIVRGYAGTGKSTIMSVLRERAVAAGFHVRFVAPTNAAAMNLYDRIGVHCGTVHNAIYKPVQKGDYVIFEPKGGVVEDKVVWITDEASMLANKRTGGDDFRTPGTLLQDFISHARKHAKTCKMVFVGDEYQLPPVMEEHSDALRANVLSQIWGGNAEVVDSQLTQVMRQDDGSPIRSMTASCIEAMLADESYSYKSSPSRIGMGREWNLQNAIWDTASKAPQNPFLEAVSIVYTNAEATFMNNAVREMMDRCNGTVVSGDHIVADKAFLIEGVVVPKGTRMFVLDVDEATHEWGGCRFQGVQLMTEMSDEPLQGLLNLDYLFSESGDIGLEAEKKLKEEAMRTNVKYRDYQNSADDEHMNAVRARFGYSMTAHKAQGREFDTVYIKPIWNRHNGDFQNWKWLYTAMTRAKSNVSTINFFAN